MVYGILQTSDGNFIVKEEGFTDMGKAKSRYHAICQNLWNDTSTTKACVMIIDENLDCAEGYKEYINKVVETPVEE